MSRFPLRLTAMFAGLLLQTALALAVPILPRKSDSDLMPSLEPED